MQAAASEPFRVLLGLQLDASAALFATGARNVMRGALYRPGTSDHRPRLSLTGVPLHAVAALLRFVYTGTVALARHTTTDILFLSEKFSIAALRSLCELYMPRVLREDNVCSVLTSAVDARAEGLVAYCTAYILRHFDGVIESPGFLKLPRALVASLLAHDDLCVMNEERLFKAILRWGLANIPITSQAYANQPQRAMDSGFTSGASAMAVANREEIVGGLLSGISFTSGTLPIIPSTSVPALKALLAELCPVLRFAHLDVPVLKSPAVGAIVASDITLTALFEKISLDQSVAAAEQNRLTSALSLEQHQQQQGDANHTNASAALQSAPAASSFELGTGMGGSSSSMGRQGGGTSATAAGMLAGSRQAMAQAVLSPHLHQQALQHGQSMASASSQSGMLGSYSVSGPSRPTIISNDLLFETGLALSMSLGTDLVAGASMSSSAHSSAGLAGGYSGLLRQQSAAAAYVSDRRTTDIPLPPSVTHPTAALEDAQASYAPPTVQSLVSGGMDAASATAILTAGNSATGTGVGMLTGSGYTVGHSSTMNNRGASLGMFGMASSGRASDGSSKRRRYGDLRSNPFLAARVPTSVPCRVGFEPHHSPEVATSNGGRTLALPASATHAGAAGRVSAASRGAHASSGRAQLGYGDVRRAGPDSDTHHSSEYPLPDRPVKGLGPLNGCEGDQGATIVAAQPSVAVPPVLHASDRDPGLAILHASYVPDRDPAVTGPTATLLPPGRVAWEMCIEDSAALLDIDPEGSDYADADVRATARSLDMGLVLPTQASRGVLGAEAGTSSQQGTAFSTAVVPGFPSSGPMAMYGGIPGGYGPYPGPYGLQGGMMYHHHPQQGYPMHMPIQSPYGMVMPPAGVHATAPASAPQLLPEHLIRPFELAICLLPAGAVSVAAATGKLRSGHPADHDVLWMVTNRGYVYSRVPSTAPAPSPPAPDAVSSTESPAVPQPPAKDAADAQTAAAADSVAPSTSSGGRGGAAGPLTLIASGCPFAVGSYVHVAVNTITGDVGVSISNVRAGFSQDEEDEEAELAGLDSSSTGGLSGGSGSGTQGGMDPVLEAAFGHVASSAGARRRGARTARLLHGLDGLLPVSDVVPPRPPPPAFTLLSTGSVAGMADAAPKVLHTADPSVSSRATLHACVNRVPLAAALYSTGMAHGLRPHTRGVQLALMARSPQGLVVTLIPPGDTAA